MPRSIASLLAALALAGCGGSARNEVPRVRAALVAFERAARHHDWSALCRRILAPALVAQVTQIGLPCEAALRRGLGAVSQPRLRIAGVRVEGARAFARVRTTAVNQPPSKDTIELDKIGGAWRVRSLAG